MRYSQSIAVIGGVAAGPAAAAEAKRTDPDARVVLFERGGVISYGACEIPLVIEGGVPSQDLILFGAQEFEEEKGVEVRIWTNVDRIAPARNRLWARDTKSGASWEERFDKFIVATGAVATRPQVENANAKNAFVVRTLDDADAVRSSIQPGLSVVVAGAGYVGLEVAEAAVRAGARVTLLAPGGRILPGYLDDELATALAPSVKTSGLQLRAERLTSVVVDPAGRVQAVMTDARERIGCKVVVFATGVAPETALATEAGARTGESGALRVTDSMKTNVPNLWACGDCVEVRRVVDDKNVHVPLSPVAYRTARVAARNAASSGRGGSSKFDGVCPASAVKVFGFEAASVGLTLAQANQSGLDAFAVDIEHWSRVKLYPGASRLKVRFVVERPRGRLLGGQLVGNDGAAMRANVLVPLIRDRWQIDRIDNLDFVYNPPVAPPLDPLYIAARAAIRELRP